jgi:hypothetical protein
VLRLHHQVCPLEVPISTQLTAAELLAAATDLTGGLDDFGDPAFREPLERLVEAVLEGDTLPAEGVAVFRADIVRLLCNRLAIQAAFTAHPEIADEDVSDPLVITGLPRTGTTKLHRVLATSPGFQKLLLWQGLFPAPMTEPGTEPDPRIAITDAQVDALLDAFPDLMAAHPLQTNEPEEEGLLLQLSFRTLGSGWIAHAYPFIEWVTQQDQGPAYADLRRALQYLQWQDGGRRNRPWLLKAPIHLNALQVLMETFPGATVVHCHRDLHEVVPSAARLYELMHQAYAAPHVELEQLGRNALLAALGWEANLAQRQMVDASRVLDVDYEEICGDIAAVVATILGARGILPDDAMMDAMAAWEQQNPQYLHGRPKYSLERYGLTPEQVDEAFSAYTAFFARA